MEDMQMIQPRRSLLFIPANRPDRFDKALASGADMVCLELEDGVAYAQKQMARQHMLKFFEDGLHKTASAEILVRINGLEESEGKADLDAILQAENKPDALMIPKIRTAQDVTTLEGIISDKAPDMALHLLIETAEALEQVNAIARASKRTKMLLFGGVDLAAELRSTTGWEALFYARGRVVHGAVLAGIDVMDMPYLAVDDEDGLTSEAVRARDMGYGGKAAIHPKQLAAIHRVFTPSAEEVAEAKRILKAYKDAPTGVVVLDGRLIEKPVIRKMHHILAMAEGIEN